MVTGRPLALPTGRSGRLLALGLTALALLLVWLAIGSPLLDWYRERSLALAGREAVAAHMKLLSGRLPALRAAAQAASVRSGPAALIDGASDAIAGAALQEQVQQMASSLGATLSSSETLAATPASAGPYRRVGVRIAVTAPFEVMVRMIAAIEQASPAMLIDDLQLHGPRIQITANSPIEGALTVIAFRHAGAGEAGGPAGRAPSDGTRSDGAASDADGSDAGP